MATNTTLNELLEMLQVELGDNLSPAHNVDERRPMKIMLNRAQKNLYEDYDWPDFFVRQDIQIVAGEKYYNYPSGFDIDRPLKVYNKWNGDWYQIDYGITSSDYNFYDSEFNPAPGFDFTDRSDPILRWQKINIDGVPMIEVWPIPATNTTLRIEGYRKLNPLLEDSDRCELDDELIVLKVAYRILARRGDSDAPLVKSHFEKRFETLKKNATRNAKITPCLIGMKSSEPKKYVRKITVKG